MSQQPTEKERVTVAPHNLGCECSTCWSAFRAWWDRADKVRVSDVAVRMAFLAGASAVRAERRRAAAGSPKPRIY